MSAELQQLLALLEARVNGKASQAAGEDEAGDLPSAGRYFANAILQPGKLAASGLAAIHAHQCTALTPPRVGHAKALPSAR